MSTSLGQRITHYRKKANLSRKQLASNIGLAYDTLRRYENDEREPNVSTLVDLAKELNITVDVLVGAKSHPDFMAQNTGESAILRNFRKLSSSWRDRIETLISWLAETPKT